MTNKTIFEIINEANITEEELRFIVERYLNRKEQEVYLLTDLPFKMRTIHCLAMVEKQYGISMKTTQDVKQLLEQKGDNAFLNCYHFGLGTLKELKRVIGIKEL